MSKRLMFSAIFATILMATTTFYVESQNADQQVLLAYEASQS